jgi:hypothetical protein
MVGRYGFIIVFTLQIQAYVCWSALMQESCRLYLGSGLASEFRLMTN